MEQHITIKKNVDGEFLGIAGGNYRIIISGENTNGSYAVIEMHVPPGGGPPPHSHPDTAEMFYVLEGAVEFKTEAGKMMVHEGGMVNIPLGGSIHCFKNTSEGLVRLLCTVVPAGLENLFREIGQPVKPGEFLPISVPSADRRAFMEALNEKYNQRIYPMNYLDKE